MKHSLRFLYTALKDRWDSACRQTRIRRVFNTTSALFLLSSAVAYGNTVTCSNSAGDAGAIQSALNAGGTVTLTGTCAIGSRTLSFGSNVVINGTATLNYSGTGYMFASAGNNNTISGLTLNGGGIHLTLNDLTNWSGQYGWTITHNTFQNITNGSGGVFVDSILGKGAHSTISYNKFHNIWTGGYPNNWQTIGNAGGGIFFNNGMDNVLIDGNKFDQIMGNAIKGFLDGFAGHSNSYIAHNIVISNNDIALIDRIGIEVQGIGKGSCPGGCNYSGYQDDGTIVKGNYMHNFFTPINNQFAFSLMFGTTHGQYINNSAVNSKGGSCNYRLAIALETVMNGGVVQGNTLSSVPLANPCVKDGGGTVGWQAVEASGYTYAGYTNYWNNNIYCQPNANWHNTDGYDLATYVYQSEFQSTNCPSGLTSETSNMALTFTSANNQNFASGGTGTWTASVVSNLAIRNVSFYLDSAKTPFAVQELSDYNSNFSNDRKWLYHGTFNTSSIGGGTHTILAKATDVSGAVQSATQSFSSGTSGTPSAQVSPSSVSFGSQTIGLKSSVQTISLRNSGSGTLTINGVSVGGTNAGDFSSVSTCGSSLSAGSSCNISLVFTPSTTGAETASVLISESASNTPLSVALSGTGSSAPSSNPVSNTTLPTNLPKGMILWLANDAGLTMSGSGVSLWQDQSGNGNDAVQATSANQPTVVSGNNSEKAVHFDGNTGFLSIPSLPIDGLTGMSVFIVSANNNDVSSAAGYGNYALLNWTETGSWGCTFFGSYQTSSRFRFGTMQTGNENTYSMPFTRTNSFGLSEWMHATTTDSMWFNGQNVGTYTGKSSSLAGTGSVVLLGQGSGKNFYPGDVSEVIVYSRSITPAERQTIEQYLMSKYHL